MKWKNRLTNYNFWVSMVSAVLLVLQACDIKFDIAHFNEIVTAVLGLLVVIGIINDPTKTSVDAKSVVNNSNAVLNKTSNEEQTPKQDSPATNNQENEADTASQNVGENFIQDVYTQIDNSADDFCDYQTTPDQEEVFVAETSTEPEQFDDFEPYVEDNFEQDFQPAEENFADENFPQVENSQIPPQPAENLACHKIVN